MLTIVGCLNSLAQSETACQHAFLMKIRITHTRTCISYSAALGLLIGLRMLKCPPSRLAAVLPLLPACPVFPQPQHNLQGCFLMARRTHRNIPQRADNPTHCSLAPNMPAHSDLAGPHRKSLLTCISQLHQVPLESPWICKLQLLRQS